MDQNYLLPDNLPDPWDTLTKKQIRSAIAIRDYMLLEGRMNEDANTTLIHLCELYLEAGLPLQRCVTIVRILHSLNAASVRIWENGKGASANVFPYQPGQQTAYEKSPSALAHRSGRWVVFNPQETPSSAFNLVSELKDAGLTGYVCAPTATANGMENVFTFATSAPGGFRDEDIALLQATFPALEACQDILVTHRILKEVTRMYIGQEPHKRVLSGDVHRGEVNRLSAAILFADMRGFTSLTAQRDAEEATALLNAYYDCVVPHVEQHGGEVLKFIGDGILAVFHAQEKEKERIEKAIAAARGSLAATAARNETERPTFEIGIAIHSGEVAYGNVGSGERLDYTVIGRDVNLAARIADLCGRLERPLLVSGSVAAVHPMPEAQTEGMFDLKGLPEPVEVFSVSGS